MNYTQTSPARKLAAVLVMLSLGLTIGFAAFGFTYSALPPVLMPTSWGIAEYPILLVGCLLLRLLLHYRKVGLESRMRKAP